MNLRDIGVEYDNHEDATLWMNPANSPMIADVVRTQVDRLQPRDEQADATGDHTINNTRAAFIVCEGFMLDIEFKRDTTLTMYITNRHGLTIAERWPLFLTLVDRADCEVLFDAMNHTRPKLVEETEKDNGKKKPKSTVSPVTTLTEVKEAQAS